MKSIPLLLVLLCTFSHTMQSSDQKTNSSESAQKSNYKSDLDTTLKAAKSLINESEKAFRPLPKEELESQKKYPISKEVPAYIRIGTAYEEDACFIIQFDQDSLIIHHTYPAKATSQQKETLCYSKSGNITWTIEPYKHQSGHLTEEIRLTFPTKTPLFTHALSIMSRLEGDLPATFRLYKLDDRLSQNLKNRISEIQELVKKEQFMKNKKYKK